eukprot:scaffold302787_cov37-Tisochrysis_lutea.AAC.1
MILSACAFESIAAEAEKQRRKCRVERTVCTTAIPKRAARSAFLASKSSLAAGGFAAGADIPGGRVAHEPQEPRRKTRWVEWTA